VTAKTAGLAFQFFCPLTLAGLLTVFLASPAAEQTLPESIAAPGGQPVMTAHAAGAQIYECAANAAGSLGWRLREPIATLMVSGHTVGRHFAGPTWQLTDGSFVVGKVSGSAPGETSDDIPWLRLEVAAGQAVGEFASVAVIQRIKTKGGVLAGACDTIGAIRSVPYSSDYVFLAKES
jgi:hypothetical protein